MSSPEVYFLNFLENVNPTAAQNAKKLEELLFEDPSSSIIKARVFAEEILEGVLQNEKDAPFLSTLFDKISYLAKEEVFTRDIQKSFDTIRLAGNKAAHDGKFNDIVEAFKLHKEVYKIGVWYYEVYSSEEAKISAYEIPKPRPKENIEEIVQKKILELLGTGILDEDKVSTSTPETTDIQEENKDQEILKKDLQSGGSYLLRELSRLKDSSQEAIENASQFSTFKDYMHVDRKIQLDLEHILEKNVNSRKGNLILLCGSVGDGKSHLLAYLKEKKPQLIDQYTIFNDATESFSPSKNAMETLEEVLQNFSDEKIGTCTHKVILAINMGVLHNFINTEHNQYTYNALQTFVEDSNLFSQDITTYFSSEMFDLLSFADYHSYEITEKGAISSFYSALVERVFKPASDNPFYLALEEDEKNNVKTMVHQNYRFLQNRFVQDQVVQLIIQTIVKKKLVISARSFLNFIADILIPDEVINLEMTTEFDKLEASLPNLLFNRRERSAIMLAMSQLDPIHRRAEVIDQLVIDLNTLTDWNTLMKEYIKDETPISWLSPFVAKSSLTGHSFNTFFESFIRITFLCNEEFALQIAEQSYEKYLKNLYSFNTGDKKQIRDFYEEIKTAIYKWKGSPKKDYIYMNKASEKFRLAQKLNLRPSIDHLKQDDREVLDTFKSSILLAYRNGDSDHKIFLDIDFPLYQLLTKVQDGYRPNKKDEEDAIKFVEFIEKLMAFGDKKEEMLVYFPQDGKFYMIKRDDFGSFVFERE
ncbi:DNA phosphorothioation-dependent restriction protein DptF [Peribacillus deserti]|uniref:DNA phosphorothioation-dependent restriction protein DptF n=1 Tax=Peribacillus deserti TaxID=673318 RepID=A0ABS2QGL3_9BACI|nr:DNA phosphorothioation-dependent restriction protein DptF [Peribacillus deserti]MBM7691628.1 DNA phosphorothioation-dependent restriction protein DptF [Peribacillus deserti]